MAFSDVSNILWRERQLLELLQFKLEVEQCLLAAGKSRWLGHATREIETMIEEVKQAELARAIEVEAVCRELGVTDAATLKALVAVAPEPWSGILEEHRKAFLLATQEIVALAEHNRELLARGYSAAREALASLGAERIQTYTPGGDVAVAKAGVTMRLLDEAL